MAYIALLFDKGFIVDEASDLESLTFVGYNEIFQAERAKSTLFEECFCLFNR